MSTELMCLDYCVGTLPSSSIAPRRSSLLNGRLKIVNYPCLVCDISRFREAQYPLGEADSLPLHLRGLFSIHL